MVPPQFTPIGSLMGSKQIRRLYRACPSSPTEGIAPVPGSHSERNSTPRFPLPCTDRQFSERSEGACTGFHHRVLYFGYCLVYHFSLLKSMCFFRKSSKFGPADKPEAFYSDIWNALQPEAESACPANRDHTMVAKHQDPPNTYCPKTTAALPPFTGGLSIIVSNSKRVNLVVLSKL